MKEYAIVISDVPRTSKVDEEGQKGIGYEKGILKNTKPTLLTPQQIIRDVGQNGKSCYAGYYELQDGEKYFSAKSFQFSATIFVDIDNKELMLSPIQALERLREYGLDCAAIYRSFNDPDANNDLSDDEMLKKCSRFRLVFFLDDYIGGYQNYNQLLKIIYQFFPEADTSVDASNIILGGKGVIYNNPDYVLDRTLVTMAAYNYSNRSLTSKRKSEKRKEYIKDLPPLINEGDILFENVPKTAGYYNNNKQTVKNGTLRYFDWEGARKKFKLLDDFLGLKRRLDHEELFGLYSGMRLISGGKKKWREAVTLNKYIDDIKIDEIAKSVEDYAAIGINYKEQYIKEYAPDDPARKYFKLTQIHRKRRTKARKIDEIDPSKVFTLTEAERYLSSIFNDFLGDAFDENITVLKVAVGVGKSYQYENSKFLDEVVIALPTHKLKEEKSKELTKNGIDHNVIPDLPNLPTKILEEYHKYLRIGKFQEATAYLRSLFNADLGKYNLILSEAAELRMKIIKYFHKLEIALGDSTPVLTTHDKIIHNNFPNHSKIIIDEDIVERLCPVKSITIETLREYRNQIKNPSIISFIEQIIEQSLDVQSISKPIHNTFRGTDQVTPSALRKLREADISGELFSLLRCEYYSIDPISHTNPDGDKQVNFIQRFKLPMDKKILVLSATADENIYNKLFDDVQFFDISNVESIGYGYQWSDRSFSRSSFNDERTQKILKNVGELAGDCPVITFMGDQYQKHFKNPYRHFDDIIGTNELTGEDIYIVGTPYQPEYFYKLWASLLEIQYPTDVTYKPTYSVEHNGYEFDITTFDHLELRELQFHFIESRLVQAIGRARMVRHPAKVNVFSAYPIKGFKQFDTKDMLTLDELRVWWENLKRGNKN